jgi:serine/threonine protein kinase
MAPEVAAETKDVDEKSDTWSLGITFIEVLDGSLEKMIKRMLSEVCLQEDNQIMAKREIAALQSSPTCDAPVSRCLRNLLYDMLIVDPDRRPSISLITDVSKFI